MLLSLKWLVRFFISVCIRRCLRTHLWSHMWEQAEKKSTFTGAGKVAVSSLLSAIFSSLGVLLRHYGVPHTEHFFISSQTIGYFVGRKWISGTYGCGKSPSTISYQPTFHSYFFLFLTYLVLCIFRLCPHEYTRSGANFGSTHAFFVSAILNFQCGCPRWSVFQNIAAGAAMVVRQYEQEQRFVAARRVSESSRLRFRFVQCFISNFRFHARFFMLTPGQLTCFRFFTFLS